ncbi:NAD(P)-dependent dehydrogenase (short-subunit alcohol dehydrogenase family) [Labrys monachus]|uniref:NAD(P)-dependent dehydrogenase (Short-subunit alcohol dehydrogenase family) n=2 Tax=Labrys monachus TaxID=217067 RepID=A0ABU0FGL0_9HYPH|nr:NAD(P)-dependent dehydrogenase (short-subunit alcohol dehydrogenase family) [Labrys monachus]
MAIASQSVGRGHSRPLPGVSPTEEARMSRLSGKVAVITGGTTGMALETARIFVEEGAYVFVTGRRQDVVDAAVASIGENVTGIQGDVSDPADLDRLFAAVKAEKGHIDVLFASAGAGHMGEPVASLSPELFDHTFDVNVKAVLFTVQKSLPLFRDGGSIILNSSIAHLKGMPGASVYSASKAAVRAFARGWTMELKERAIRVNVISPGPIDTPFTQPAPQGWKDAMTAMVPMGRFGQPREIATAALFLASEDSSFITGIDLCVDGGLTQV